ncbi:MAG: fructan beta-fructosidase [Verrucomicrobiales bacterium]
MTSRFRDGVQRQGISLETGIDQAYRVIMRLIEMITPALLCLAMFSICTPGLHAQNQPEPAAEEPAGTEEPAAEPAVTEEPTVTEDPATTEEAATEEPAATTEEPAATTEEPAATTEESAAPEELTAAEEATTEAAATEDAVSPPEDTPPPAPARVAKDRQFGPITPTDRFLNLPVKTGAPKSRMTLSVDGQTVREFDIELSDEPDLWVFTDLTAFAGKSVTVTVDAIDSDSQAIDMLETGAIKNAHQLYQEPLRPQFHFSTKRGWINDPNGLVYHKGKYHLFYQHNPYGWAWGNIHWGHAVSTDLVHWEQHPIALYPKAYDDWAFSGGALMDEANTSGFKDGPEDVMVAFYTSTGRGECVVYSNDLGTTWTEFEGNPVIKHQGRDPKVIWHESSRRWVMAVYNEFEEKRYISFHTSTNLKEWTFQSRIEGFYECPEIFEISIDLNPLKTKWVLYGADGNYLLGSFDGKTFTPDGEKIQGNYGNCFYASQMYSNIPKHDNRQIQVGWGKIDMPGMPFNQQMLFPCELRLRSTEEGPRLHTTPVREIARAYASSEIKEKQSATGTSKLATGELLDIEATFNVSQAQKLTFDLRGTAVTLDVSQGELSCLDKKAPIKAKDDKISLRLLVDRTTIEIFGNEGRVYMPMGVILDADKQDVSLTVDGTAEIERLRVSTLGSIWTH